MLTCVHYLIIASTIKLTTRDERPTQFHVCNQSRPSTVDVHNSASQRDAHLGPRELDLEGLVERIWDELRLHDDRPARGADEDLQEFARIPNFDVADIT